MQALAPESETPEITEPAAADAGEAFVMDTPAEAPAEEPGGPVPADIPEWLQGLAPAEAATPAAAAEPVAAEPPLAPFEEAAPPVGEAAVEAPAAAGEAETPDWLEGEQMPSGEEALAWLEQLAAGKEEELQAQVEAEIEVRTAEIMGRPKPVELEAAPGGLGEVPESETPQAAEPAAADAGEAFVMDTPAETPAEEPGGPVPADIPEWLQGLAPAEAATPATAGEPVAAEPPLAPFEEAAPPVGEAAVEIPAAADEAAPDWLEGEQMPSGEEALAWLEQLAVGKEEELQAQVEAEIEARTAEIMGRPKPAESEAAPVEETAAPVEAAPAEGLAPAEIPGWMQDLAPTDGGAPDVAGAGPAETAPPLGEPVVETADVAFGWTGFTDEELVAEGGLPPVEDVQPPAEPAPLPAEALGRSVVEELGPPEEVQVPPSAEASGEGQPAPEEVVAASIGEAFGWTGFGEVEQAAVEAEQALPEAGVPVVAGDVAPAPESVPLREEAEAPPAVERPVAEQAPSVEAMAVEGLLEEPAIPSGPVAPPPVPESVPVPVAPAPPSQPPRPQPAPKPSERSVVDPFAAERAHLKENPRDYDAWLSLARDLWQTGDRSAALTAYTRLIRAGKSLDTVTTELEEYAEKWPDVATRRVLGDAYMKSGKLDRALALYREALDTL
jgi:hypothetical protein